MSIMESPKAQSPVLGSISGQSGHSSRSRSSLKLVDDVTSLTSFNPFSEEDEHDQSSYALVSSLFSKVRNTLSAPLTTATTAATVPSAAKANTTQSPSVTETRRPSIQYSNSNTSNKSNPERPNPLNVVQANPAPPLVSLTPVTSEVPSYVDMERTPSQGGSVYASEGQEGGGYGGGYGTYIPGFPIQDSDARSIRTVGSTHLRRSDSVSKVIRRIRGEGMFEPGARHTFPLTMHRPISRLLDGRRVVQGMLRLQERLYGLEKKTPLPYMW